MSATRCFFRLSFPSISAGISRPTRRNKYRAGARKLEMKKVRLTATRVSVSHYNRFKLRFAQSRLLHCGGNIVEFAYDAPGLLDAPSTSHREDIRGDISLFEKRMRYLFIGEKRPRLFFIRETCVTSLYIFDTKRIRDEISEMKTKTLQRMAIFYIT